MPIQTEINNLTRTMSEFIRESSERAVRLETTQEHISEALLKMTQTVDKALMSNTKLEMKVSSLEDKAIDRLYLVEDSLNEVNLAYKDILGRVGKLEIIQAKELGKQEARAGVFSFISNNWFKIVTVGILLIPLVSWLYDNVNNKQPTAITRGK